MLKLGHSILSALLAGGAWLTAAHALALTPPVPEPVFQRLFTEDHSNSSDYGAVRVLAQDVAGFIWVGAEYALARLDASGPKVYPVDDFNPRTLASGYINDLLSDSAGELWIATDSGLHRYHREHDNFIRIMLSNQPRARVAGVAELPNGELIATLPNEAVRFDRSGRVLAYYPYPRHNSTAPVTVGRVLVDSRGRAWIANLGAGALRLDLDSGQYELFNHDPANPDSIASDQVQTIAEDSQGRIWFGFQNHGISRLDEESGHFTHFRADPDDPHSLPANNIWDLHFDRHGELWVATDQGGLARAQGPDWRFQVHYSRASDLTTLSSNQLRSVLEDRRGDLWIGAFPTGLNYLRRRDEPIYNFIHRPDNANSLSHNGIIAVREDKAGNIWVGTEGGLNRIDADGSAITRWTRADGLAANAVLSICPSDNGDIWFGTWSGGVHRLPAGGGPPRVYQTADGLSQDSVWSIARDRQGMLWFGTEGGGLDRYDPATGSFTNFSHRWDDPESLDSNYIWSLAQGHSGELWVGTSGGLNRFDPATGKVERFPLGGRPGRTSSESRVRSLLQDSTGDVWAGTQENGLFRLNPATGQSAHYSLGAGLPSAYVSGLAEDQDGFIWATTTKGVVKIDPATMAMQVFTRSHGLAGAHFNRDAILVDRAGQLYLGSTEGLSVLHPRTLKPHNLDLPVAITELSVMNRPVAIGGADHILNAAPWATQQIQLKHTQPVFGFKFSALDYRQIGQHHYRYRLEGFDTDWQEAVGNTASYTNLKPGRYQFRVQAGTQDGFSAHEAGMTVLVAPAPWRSTAAYGIYALLAAAVASLIYAAIRRHYAFLSERQVNAELLKLNEIKDAFLANTSHELRTPLNGIIGIAENLATKLADDPFAHHRLGLIATSGKRLASLINDILDYSKLAKQNLSLRLENMCLHEMLEQVFALLAPLAADKPVQLINELTPNSEWVRADVNRLQQILINLVGNGIKYTKAGAVRVSASSAGDMVEITVTDTGIGIEPSQMDSVFEAFQQLQKSDARQYGGTGLGLAITRQLVELHGGRIWVDREYSAGARLVFTLPKATFEADSLVRTAATIPPVLAVPPPNLRPVPSPSPPAVAASADQLLLPPPRNARHQTILVVDDDPINRMVLSGILALHHYRVVEASSGAEALALLESGCPAELMILDVMMPDMGGFETCQKVRERFPLHEMPVLFLTAKRNVDEDLASCFRVGGNDFLTKPVSKYDLLPRVANHLRIVGIVRKLTLDLHAARGEATPISARSG